MIPAISKRKEGLVAAATILLFFKDAKEVASREIQERARASLLDRGFPKGDLRNVNEVCLKAAFKAKDKFNTDTRY